MRWRFVAQKWNDAASKKELRAQRGASLVLNVNSPSKLSFVMPTTHRQAAMIEELVTDVTVSIDGTDIERFRCGSTNDTCGETAATTAFSFNDYRSVLRRRALKAADTLSYSGIDQAVIAMSLIDSVQARANGDYGITAGVGSPTGVVRTRNFQQGQYVGKEIQDMSDVANGFDWHITPDMKLDIYYPRRGEARGVALEYGKTVTSLTRTRNPSDFANDTITTGGQGTTPVEEESATVATDSMGRWDDTVSYPDVSEQATLAAKGLYTVAKSSIISPKYNVRLKKGWWGGTDHIWLGDTVRLLARHGRINDDLTMRVVGMTIAIDDDTNGEVVSLSLEGES